VTVTVVWTCDRCAATFERELGTPGGLSTPTGWTVQRSGDAYQHSCPACTRPEDEVVR
jgi:ribosomal protein L37AE/L43A